MALNLFTSWKQVYRYSDSHENIRCFWRHFSFTVTRGVVPPQDGVDIVTVAKFNRFLAEN